MGTMYRFWCPGCRYRAQVSGGDDAGLLVRTTTISCDDCHKLYDIETRKVVVTAQTRIDRSYPVQCPKDPRHTVHLWRHPGPCPRCGETMEQGEMVMLWD